MKRRELERRLVRVERYWVTDTAAQASTMHALEARVRELEARVRELEKRVSPARPTQPAGQPLPLPERFRVEGGAAVRVTKADGTREFAFLDDPWPPSHHPRGLRGVDVWALARKKVEWDEQNRRAPELTPEDFKPEDPKEGTS